MKGRSSPLHRISLNFSTKASRTTLQFEHIGRIEREESIEEEILSTSSLTQEKSEAEGVSKLATVVMWTGASMEDGVLPVPWLRVTLAEGEGRGRTVASGVGRLGDDVDKPP